MARFSVEQANNYGGQGGGGYFSLKNDGDTATVRFLFDSIEDVEAYSVHEVELNGKKRYVSCLREYGDPVSACPMCAAGRFTQVKYFVPLYNEDTDKVVTWERGKKFGAKLTSMCARYPHLVSHTFEIERNGKPGDTATTYEIYETGMDDTSIEDFEVPSALGGLVLEKSADELSYYLDYQEFPDGDAEPVRRRDSRNDSTAVRRRTPMGNTGRDREPF